MIGQYAETAGIVGEEDALSSSSTLEVLLLDAFFQKAVDEVLGHRHIIHMEADGQLRNSSNNNNNYAFAYASEPWIRCRESTP